MEFYKGQIVKAVANGVAEKFKVVKIGRKYAYFVSNQYSSDGMYRCLKNSWTEEIELERC